MRRGNGRGPQSLAPAQALGRQQSPRQVPSDLGGESAIREVFGEASQENRSPNIPEGARKETRRASGRNSVATESTGVSEASAEERPAGSRRKRTYKRFWVHLSPSVLAPGLGVSPS